MEQTFLSYTVIIVFLSILIEIVFFPVPSVASTYQLLCMHDGENNGEGILDRVRMLPLMHKFLILIIPTGISVMTFCIPLVLVFFPVLRGHVYPLTMLEIDLLVITGIFLMLIGRMISFYTVFKIRLDNSQTGEDFSLKTGSIFSISRNPIVVGMHFTYLGFILAFPSLLLIIGFVIHAGNLHFRILLEEDFLKEKFRNNYEYYLQHSKRYL